MKLTRILLLSGLLSSVVYALINVVVPLGWRQYSIVDQTVSELSAIGAPTRTLWLALVIPYVALFAAFGWGMLRVAGPNKGLKIAGWLIFIDCAFSMYWPPMHQREVLASGGGTLTDTLHLVWAGVTVLLFVAIMICGALCLGRKFRIYTAASIVVLIFCGMLTSQGAPNVGRNLPTPWIGVWERLNIGVFLLWVAFFSTSLMRLQTQRDRQ